MMHPADHGLTVLCGEWDDVNRHIIEAGLDPVKVIHPHGGITLGLIFTADQIVFLDGWAPDAATSQWFWQSVATRMGPGESEELLDKASRVRGLVPEAFMP